MAPARLVFSALVSPSSQAVGPMTASKRGCTVVQVPHVRQTQNWDCGLACVMMVLEALGMKGCDFKGIKGLCPTMSTWTVDLAYLLHHFGVDVLFLTVTLGANPDFASESFYLENMQEDEHRVNRLFRQAPTVGIPIHCGSISSHLLQQTMLSGMYLIIALVDKRKLNAWFNVAPLCGSQLCALAAGYTGHYVVICGFDSERQEYLIQDPARSSSAGVWVAADVLEAARKTFGTDEDLLIVPISCSMKIDRSQAPGTPAMGGDRPDRLTIQDKARC